MPEKQSEVKKNLQYWKRIKITELQSHILQSALLCQPRLG